MADEKRKRITLATPKGTLVWPKLNEPDYGNENFPKPDGEYSLKLRVRIEDPAVAVFLRTMQPHYAAAMAAGRVAFAALKVDARKKLKDVTENPLYSTVYDKETEEPTGEIEFKIAMAAGGVSKKGPRAGQKWSAKPAIFDAKGKPLTNPPKIWGGTVAKVSFEFDEGGYFIPGSGAAGLKMRLKAVQIIELSNGQAKDAAGFGFGSEEGYEAGDDNAFADESGLPEQTGSDNATGDEDF